MIAGYECWAFDYEVFPNFACVGFMNVETAEVRQFSTEPGLGESFNDLRAWWPKFNSGDVLLIGFNSLGYDNFIHHAVIIEGVDDPAMLYQRSVSIIQGNAGVWNRNVLRQVDREISIDIMAMSGGRIGSLKEISIKLGHPHVQELPYPYDRHLDSKGTQQ